MYESEFIKSEPQFNRIIEAGDRIQLLAGTAWLFSRDELDCSLDYLMIDEAGQVSLADALAMAPDLVRADFSPREITIP